MQLAFVGIGEVASPQECPNHFFPIPHAKFSFLDFGPRNSRSTLKNLFLLFTCNVGKAWKGDSILVKPLPNFQHFLAKNRNKKFQRRTFFQDKFDSRQVLFNKNLKNVRMLLKTHFIVSF